MQIIEGIVCVRHSHPKYCVEAGSMSVVKSKQASDDTSHVEIVVAMETKFAISNYLQSPSMIRELYTKYTILNH